MKQTPKQKAMELVDKYMFLLNVDLPITKTKQCALIAVDELIEIFNDTNGSDYRLEYWQKVKQEIEKL